MKIVLGVVALLALSSSVALAAPGKSYGFNGNAYNGGRVTVGERIAIARSQARVALVRRSALRDGRITFSERLQIRNAELQLAALKRRVRFN